MIAPSAPGRVLELNGTVALLDIRGVRVTANAQLVSIKPGDFVLVYGGVILRVLTEKEAAEKLATLEALDSAAACPRPP